jgi:hypothetical protein
MRHLLPHPQRLLEQLLQNVAHPLPYGTTTHSLAISLSICPHTPVEASHRKKERTSPTKFHFLFEIVKHF